jgi:hypothetical protein
VLVHDRRAQLVAHPHGLAAVAPAPTAGKVAVGRRAQHADRVGPAGQLGPIDDLVGGLVFDEELGQPSAERQRVRYHRPVRDQGVGVDQRRAPQVEPDRSAHLGERLEPERVDVKTGIGEQPELMPAPRPCTLAQHERRIRPLTR